MIISCTDYSFASVGDNSFEDAASAVAALGFGAIDISVRRRFPLTPPELVEANPPSIARERRAILGRLGLKCADVFLIEEPPSPDPASADPSAGRPAWRFESVAQFTKEMDAPGVTVLPDGGVAWWASDRVARAVTELRRRVAIAASLGLELSVEPHHGSIAGTPTAAIELLDAVPGLKLTLDYSHFIAAGIAPGAVHPLITRSRVIQLRQARRGLVQTSLADGVLDIRDICHEARRRAFSGSFTTEYVASPALASAPVDATIETVALRKVLLEVDRELEVT